jgi:hypothetical protein
MTVSRNAREGWYAGQFRWGTNPDAPRRHRRQPYGNGMFLTLREYDRLRRAAARQSLRLIGSAP